MNEQPPPHAPIATGRVYELTQDDRTMAAAAHALGAFTSILGPALLYFAYDGRSRFVQYHALQSLAVQGLAIVVFLAVVVLSCGIGVLLIPPLGLGLMVAEIVVATKAYEGQWWNYPKLEKVGAELRPVG